MRLIYEIRRVSRARQVVISSRPSRLSQSNLERVEGLEMNNAWLSEEEARRQREMGAGSDVEQMSEWDSESRTGRISMRIEPSLKEAFSKSLPPYA